ncbi:vacuolar protein sorting-associated protein 26B-like isoform X2 [Scomber japonicus]|uniref:vacuolar protein sorting-associated protein 26B-like isoform X2 n=1 Tax=Scomber japonicus TaxID=13676 RepID=UPI0023057E7C|nr:vacuolar protein sorting-associated protein 26B-like isoform X2 [Scomber japonicus]
MSFFSFGQTAEIDVVLNDAETRKKAEHKTEDGKKDKYFLFYDGETVSGKVNVTLKNPGKRLEHQGIKIEFVGQIELYYDRGNHHEFVSLVKDLARPGEITQSQTFDFEFTHVEKPYESYTGQNVKLRYFLRASVIRRLNDITKEMDIVVHTLSTYPELNSSIKMEVGIEDCLHIEFEYNKSKYHLKDVIVGKIYFLLVRIKIKHMEIDIIKRETTGTGPSVYHENDTIAKYEIMDGAPVRGESIPIRLFLAGYDLTPTMRDINKKFSVRYYLNLVLIDEEERRYFKQQFLKCGINTPSSFLGDHTVEKRGRGKEEHVSPGSHRLSEVRGLSRFRECNGKDCKGGKRVEPPPSSLLSQDSSASASE